MQSRKTLTGRYIRRSFPWIFSSVLTSFSPQIDHLIQAASQQDFLHQEIIDWAQISLVPQEMSGGLFTQKDAVIASAPHLSQLYWTQVHIINYRPGSIKIWSKKFWFFSSTKHIISELWKWIVSFEFFSFYSENNTIYSNASSTIFKFFLQMIHEVKVKYFFLPSNNSLITRRLLVTYYF